VRGEGLFDRRVIGRYSAGREGPGIVVIGGLHGNEPAGVIAAGRVLERLERERCPLRGEITALAGNLAALARGTRFVDYDLNRCWLEETVATPRGHSEDAELAELIEAMDRVPGPRVIVDLHTTSGPTPPFTLMSDVRRNRRIAFALPAPVILGLEETIDGTLLEYMTERGHTALVVETGQHEDPASADLHEAVIWMALEATGALDADDVPERDVWRRRFAAACRGLPRVVEVRHRHAIGRGEGFRMEPGHVGFEKVTRGQVLGHDRRGPVHAPEDGRLLMPLYQQQGNDGYYLIRKVSRFWVWLSTALRRLKADRLLPLLPGVRRHPELAHTLIVDPKVARVLVVEIFHLFGFRKHRAEGDRLVFTRRRPG
jgi:succinylglutamate desuccinylase